MNIACFGSPELISLPGWEAVQFVPQFENDVEQLHECAFAHILVHHSFGRIEALKAAADFFSIPLSGYCQNGDHHTGRIFKSAGIARMLSTEQLIRYGQRVLEMPGEPEKCSVLACDTDEVMLSMIRTICDHFGCELEIAADQNQALEALGDSHDLFLLNIDQKGFECTRFVHRASSMRSMMKALFVPYMSTGLIHVSDILSGLGRFSKVILSADELYSFLITLFHNIGLQRTSSDLVKKIKPLTGEFSPVSIRQLHTEMQTDLFTMDCACNEKVESTWESLEALRTVVARVVPFKWLVMRHRDDDLCTHKKEQDPHGMFPFM